MRMLNRNKRPCYYALPIGRQKVLDDEGYETLEWETKYSDPERLMVNYSAGRGEEDVNAFGLATDYSLTLAFSNHCPLCESAILWIGTELENAANYKVVKVARGINSTLVALREIV